MKYMKNQKILIRNATGGEDTNEKLDTTDKTLKIVVKKLDIAVEDRVVKTKSKLKNESFILMFNPNETYKYKVIRAKKEYVNTRIDKLRACSTARRMKIM